MTNNTNITITDTARAHIKNQLQLTGAQYLRLGVKESGCNGFMYMLDFHEAPDAEDHCFDFGDQVRVCVRTTDLDMVAGTEVDMITEGLNSALVFKNPNATSYCGCGESFAVGDHIGGDDPAGDLPVDASSLAIDVGAN